MHVNREIVMLEEYIQYMTDRLAREPMPAMQSVIRRNINFTKQKIKNIQRIRR
jgi:hypothetical protein